MRLQRNISYGLIASGALVAARALVRRWRWDEANVLVAIMLDWDDVQAVASRTTPQLAEADSWVETLLRQYQAEGATHLSIPELTLERLLARGQLTLEQGPAAGRIYLRAKEESLAALVLSELQARLPHLAAESAEERLVSFRGDLPTVAEVGLGFHPDHAALAHTVGLSPVARPVGYSWIQPEMIDRTLAQAAKLGARVVAVQGDLVPGHEFNMQATVRAMRRHGLTYAYFSQSRHQKGDWFLAKNLARDGLVIPAHEFQPAEMLEDDWHTLSYRWARLATEAGIRLCAVRFFRVLHAADPLESLAYIRALREALEGAGMIPLAVGAVDLTPYHPQPDAITLAAAGLSTAGAMGLAADRLPFPDQLKLATLGMAAMALSALPFLEKFITGSAPDHDHEHEHHHGHPHHHDHGHHHHHGHPPHTHEHEHHHHDHNHHDRTWDTAYASKGIALAAGAAYAAAAPAIDELAPPAALLHTLALSGAGAVALNAAITDPDYLLAIEPYQGYNLDWLLPLGLAMAGRVPLPLIGLALAALGRPRPGADPDRLAALDREHRHAHTHHLSAFQRLLGDLKMALSLKPLRKWAFLGPVGVMTGALLQRSGKENLAIPALAAATAGQIATLAGFRNGQRSLGQTLGGRARPWLIGAVIGGAIWLIGRIARRDGG